MAEHGKGRGRWRADGQNPVIDADRQLARGGAGCGNLGFLHAPETLDNQRNGQDQHANGNG